MIAHINRSGEMFHENVNVLEYAAVSMTVKHFNPNKNKSIMKSAKSKSARTKSCLKNQAEDKDNSLEKNKKKKKTAIKEV